MILLHPSSSCIHHHEASFIMMRPQSATVRPRPRPRPRSRFPRLMPGALSAERLRPARKIAYGSAKFCFWTVSALRAQGIKRGTATALATTTAMTHGHDHGRPRFGDGYNPRPRLEGISVGGNICSRSIVSFVVSCLCDPLTEQQLFFKIPH